MKTKTIMVIGAGQMGSGIAEVFAAKGTSFCCMIKSKSFRKQVWTVWKKGCND
ncbi:hypothetical protein JCM19047_1167 [Bacillus sp. JCM 19047]|nr:hypothetical protein JCM19047_1167 [Bacillus sp. JCM 19047]